jgi:hypothetical protein
VKLDNADTIEQHLGASQGVSIHPAMIGAIAAMLAYLFDYAITERRGTKTATIKR